jgi:hypothetical protein
MEAIPSIQICQDCGVSILARERQSRCLGCRQRYEVQMFLLRQFLTRAR